MPAEASHGGPSAVLGGMDVGALCIAGSAVVWSRLARNLLPKLRLWVLNASWWARCVTPQKCRLWEAGFPRTSAPPMFLHGTTDGMAADMFGWFSLYAAVSSGAGLLTLPVVFSGWTGAGDAGQGAFLFGTILAAGWSLFDTIDATMRSWLTGRFPTGCSGLTWPCPRRFWLRYSVLHHPFWLTLVLPMNAHLPQLDIYHYLVSTLLFSAAWQHGTRCDPLPNAATERGRADACARAATPAQSCPPCAPCSRQYAMTLDLMDPSCLRRFKTLVAVELLNALCFRGAIFGSLAFRCSDKLRSNSDTTSADMASLPMLFMAIFSVLSIIDALKNAMRWLPAKPGARALGQEATLPLQATDEDSHSRAAHNRVKSKARVPGRASRQPPPTSPPDGSDDDELVFGGAQDGPELDDAEPADAPEPAVAARAARPQRHRSRAVGGGLIFGKSYGAASSVSAAARQAPADSPQFPTGRGVPQSAQRAESVVFPSKWTAEEDDGVSMVSAPITPLERQRRTAQAERERVDADERRRLHADQVEKARAQALDEAERRRERTAKRSRAAEQQQREEEEQVRDRRRRRADADAVHQAQRDTHERGERLRVEAEQAANLSHGSTEAPPMVDHDSILTSGRLPK